MSVDGFAAARDGDISWHATDGFEDMTPDQLAMLEGVHGIVIGAETYRLFAGYWPTADPTAQAVATPINRLPKYVVSNSLDRAPWGVHAPATVVGGGLSDVVAGLRERADGDLLVWGSLRLAASLARLGEIDVVRLRTVPRLLGRGIGFLPEDVTAGLQRTDLRSYPGGHTVIEYAVVPPPA